MLRPRLSALCIVAIPLGCTAPPTLCTTRLQAIAADVASHAAATIPLGTQSDCAGASRPPFNEQSETTVSTCAPDDSDSECLACVRTACCTIIDENCVGASASACAATEAVENCFVGALAGPCATDCEAQ
jgi:hypothetical protein